MSRVMASAGVCLVKAHFLGHKQLCPHVVGGGGGRGVLFTRALTPPKGAPPSNLNTS